LHARELRRDCDGDTLLLVADPEGPSCHTDERTCFGEDSPTAAGMVEELARVIARRAREHSRQQRRNRRRIAFDEQPSVRIRVQYSTALLDDERRGADRFDAGYQRDERRTLPSERSLR